MIECNPTKCHNFDWAVRLNRCSFVSVCNDDCVFVWKHFWENSERQINPEDKIEELEEKISNLEIDLENAEEEADENLSTAEFWEERYNDAIKEISEVIGVDKAKMLQDYLSDTLDNNWVDYVRECRGEEDVSRTE